VYRHRTATAAGALLLLALVLAVAARRGERGRVTLSTRRAVSVSSPEEAYRVWDEAGVRGRILLVFDRYPHLDLAYESYRAGARPDDRSFLDFAVFGGVVRKIYWVVPEDAWDDVSRQEQLYHVLRRLDGEAMVLLVNDNSGIPLVAATPSALPPIPEDVLVYVNGTLYDAAQIAALLERLKIATDLAVVLESGSAR
jgi:hypothetical protein